MKNYTPKKKNITLLKMYLNNVKDVRNEDKRNNTGNGLPKN